MDLKKLIRDIPDFPKAGILFRDISPLLKSTEALGFVSKAMVAKTDLTQIDYFAGVESRGFILAMLLSAHHGKGFLPIRKAGKLPPPTVKGMLISLATFRTISTIVLRPSTVAVMSKNTNSSAPL